jgi:F-type H+-transporting ATPase subunit b
MIKDRRGMGVGVMLIAVLAAAFLCVAVSPVGASTPAYAAEEAAHGTEGHATEGHGGEAAHGSDSSEKLMDLLYRTLCFAVVFLGLFFLLRKIVPQFLSNRRESIKQELDELEKKKKDTEAMLGDFRKKLKEIESERDSIIEQYVKEGEAEKEKIIEQAKLMGERIEEQARWTIDQEVKRAKTDLRSEIAELAAAMAEEVIRKNIREEDEKRLVDEYLEKVVETA